jgi:hypothetical protein
MHLKSTIGLMALSAGLVAAAPAGAQSGHHHGQGAGSGGGDVPSRVAKRVKRAERALDRASGYADDGNEASATSSLGAVRKNLAAAVKAANKRVAAAADNGPDAAGAAAGAQHDVITEVSGLFDGADGLVDPLNTTLNGAIDGRDSLVAAIAALSADDQQAYVDVLDGIDSDVTDEIDGIDQALSDDTLTDAAKADLTAARDKLTATKTAVEGLLANLDTSNTTAADDGSGDGSCAGHHGGPRDDAGVGDGSSSGNTAAASRRGRT